MSLLTASSPSAEQSRLVRRVWWAAYALTIGCGWMIATIAQRRIDRPFIGLTLAIVVVLLVGWTIRPLPTLYAVIFLTTVSDIVTVWWFPFAKNLSSRESIAFVADALTFSPLDLSLYLGFAISTIRRYAATRTLLPRTPLTWPLLTFTGFILFGYARGLTAGGNLRIAILEGRTLVYIFLVFVIIANECTDRRHFRAMLGAALAGVFVQTLLTIEFLGRLDAAQRAALRSLNEHGSALGHSLVIVTLVALVLLQVRAPVLKTALLVASVPIAYVFLVGERRSGIAALAVGFTFVLISLLWRRRTAFFVFTPIAVAVVALYVAAFAGSDSTIGFPAQAIKAVVTPGAALAEDQSSDYYRRLEHFNLNYTIKSDPLTGQGFGRPFLRPVQLADISFFELNAYVPHNNVLWIWIKMGFGGFVAMFYVFATAIMLGADRVRRATDPIDLTVSISAVSFVAMYAVYSYVDVSWDARNTVLLGVFLATCATRPEDRDEVAVASETPRDLERAAGATAAHVRS